MKNNNLLIERIHKGIKFIQKQEEKLQPIIDYLTENCLTGATELPPDKSFEYLIQFMSMKTECLLLLTKMQEILEYKEV